MSRAAGWWRHAGMLGAAAGLAASPHLQAPPGWLPCAIVASLALAALSARHRPAVTGGSGTARLVCLALLGALMGLGVGGARVESIDSGALADPIGAHVDVTGYVTAVPRRSYGEVRFPLRSADGLLVVVAREPIGELPVGRAVEVEGTLAEPDPFRRSELERAGAALELRADELQVTQGRRGGLAGIFDGIRTRAELALGEGMDEPESALARGFVLGQDDLIEPETRDAFKRSGLAHLLAVSGQNVMLLAILAGVILGLLGVGLRTRLLVTLLLIAVYVPVAGAGASIQRAGVVGAAGILATLVGRPSDRAYLVLLAATATLLINPRFSSDVGWQLSFAAVIGIALWAAPLRDVLLGRLSRLPDRLARPLAEGAALTIAATVATAPLMAHYFERVSIAALPANLLVIIAIGPVMWLGMLIALLGQLPAIPVAPLGHVEGVLIDFVVDVATALSSPSWAQISLPLPGSGAIAGVYVVLALLLGGLLAKARRRRGLVLPSRLALATSLVALLAVALPATGPERDAGDPAAGTLRITELDVGQGDATLLQPAHGAPVLVDGGPPGGAAVEELRDHGVDRLRAVFVTHDQLDHAGGLFEVLAAVPVGELVHATPAPRLAAAARAAGTRVVQTAEGGSFELGRLDLDVLWPPREPGAMGAPAEDPNLASIVMVARFGGYDALLTGDAEAEATHIDPGPIDVLKVAHHGSDDAGLDALLAESVPRVALIGVGADNTYGHPTPDTLATLAEHGVCTLRTDLDGSSTVELGPTGVRAWTEREDPASAPDAGCASSGG